VTCAWKTGYERTQQRLLLEPHREATGCINIGCQGVVRCVSAVSKGDEIMISSC
jgi:hypothetical protein